MSTTDMAFLRMSAVLLMAVAPFPAAAHMPLDVKAYCKQLISFYDRYGASRSEYSDGPRWIIVQNDDVGRIKVQSALLTDEGRRLARKGLRG
jgi:hypothetical protein